MCQLQITIAGCNAGIIVKMKNMRFHSLQWQKFVTGFEVCQKAVILTLKQFFTDSSHGNRICEVIDVPNIQKSVLSSCFCFRLI